MIIPKQIQLMSQPIAIKYDKTLNRDDGCDGLADFSEYTITLDSHRDASEPINKIFMERVYLHELTHWILHMMGEERLCHNEKFVEVFSNLLHQALQYSEPKNK